MLPHPTAILVTCYDMHGICGKYSLSFNHRDYIIRIVKMCFHGLENVYLNVVTMSLAMGLVKIVFNPLAMNHMRGLCAVLNEILKLLSVVTKLTKVYCDLRCWSSIFKNAEEVMFPNVVICNTDLCQTLAVARVEGPFSVYK